MPLIKSISGIRGTIGDIPGENLTSEDVKKFTLAYAQWLKNSEFGTRPAYGGGVKNAEWKVIIGRDARTSGKWISKIVASALQSLGIDVIDLGLSTTPTVEVAVANEKANGGIIITASHNPVEWNALKLLNEKGEFISAKDGEEILKNVEFRIRNAELKKEKIKKGIYSLNKKYLKIHIQKILSLPLVNKSVIKKRKFRIAVDCVNSTGGIFVPALLKALGVTKIFELYTKPNGKFPHNPEPLPENLQALSKLVKKKKADLGIAVDPDVDRLAIVCEDGEMFGEEYTLVACADYILSKKKGNTVSNLSSTRALRNVTETHGGKYFTSAVGEVNVVAKMKEVNAVIGGEGNGGVIYPCLTGRQAKLHYGRDALVGIALFLSHLAKSNMKCSELRKKYPNYFISKNKIDLKNIDAETALAKIRKKYSQYPINTEDGVKIDLPEGWIHLRKSNTEPILRIYTEAKTKSEAENLVKNIFDEIHTLTNG